MTERAAFGAELRRTRERRELTLDAIAEQTKVSATHFAGLERGDLSRWPSGIFRRAFVRHYAIAVGLDPEETVTRFTRLFPEASEAGDAAPSRSEKPRAEPAALSSAPTGTAADEDEPGLRLALEQARPPRSTGLAPTVRRVLAGLVDISIAVMPAALVALAVGTQWFWLAVACISMSGHLACYAALGTTPGAWFVARLTTPAPVVAAAPAERRRADADPVAAPRRRVTRQSASRHGQHAHRVRH